VKGRLLLDVVVGQGAAVLQLFTGEDETLLVWRDTLLVLNLRLYVFDRVGSLDLERDRLARQRFDEDLHSSSEAEDEMKSGLLLNVVVRQCAAILELFAGEDETLLVWRNPFFILNFGLDVFDGVRRLDLEGDGLSRQSLDENLHSSSESKDQVKGRLLLDVVVGQSAAVLQLLASEDETLLVWRDAFFVLDLGLDIFDRVRSFDLEGDRFARQRLDKDLHSSSEAEDQVKSGFLLDVVVGQRAPIFQLFAGKNETLLVWGNPFFILDFGLDIFDSIGSLDLERDGLARQRLDEDLHATA